MNDKINTHTKTLIQRIFIVISMQETEMNKKNNILLYSLLSTIHQEHTNTHKRALYVLNPFIFDKLMWSFYGIPKPKYVGCINLNKPCDLKRRIDRIMGYTRKTEKKHFNPPTHNCFQFGCKFSFFGVHWKLGIQFKLSVRDGWNMSDTAANVADGESWADPCGKNWNNNNDIMIAFWAKERWIGRNAGNRLTHIHNK